jgi:undecaprenyl diphosphate synthase
MNARSTKTPKAAAVPDEAELRKQLDFARLPRHVAIILDGNGRWAATRFLPRIFGHRQGAKAVREVVTLSRELGIETLSLYAFSNENWKRPKDEVTALMELLKKYLHGEIATMMENKVRFRAIGQIDRLPAGVVQLIRSVEAQTADHRGMTLLLALSYGGRAEIVDATRRIAEAVRKGEIQADQIDEALFSAHLYAPDLPDPDLLIRTSGEVRISNFFLWEAAYTELYFTETLWPNFGRCDFLTALLDYQKRERRFGHVHPAAPAEPEKRAR